MRASSTTEPLHSNWRILFHIDLILHSQLTSSSEVGVRVIYISIQAHSLMPEKNTRYIDPSIQQSPSIMLNKTACCIELDISFFWQNEKHQKRRASYHYKSLSPAISYRSTCSLGRSLALSNFSLLRPRVSPGFLFLPSAVELPGVFARHAICQ
jgi:hypothetical protein